MPSMDFSQSNAELQEDESNQFETRYSDANRPFQETYNTSNINFLNFLLKEIPYEYKLKKLKTRKSLHEPVCFEIDDSHRFRNTVSITKTGNSTIQSLSSSSRNSGIREHMKKIQLENDLLKQFEKNLYVPRKTDVVPVEVLNWEDCVFEEDPDVDSISNKEYINDLIASDWEKHIFTDTETMPLFKDYLTLYIDDPNLIFEKIEEKKVKVKKKNSKTSTFDKPIKNKYNISNDKYYTSDSKNKVSLGTFGVQHSLPALKLDTKFYKTNHSKEELRNFHRNYFNFKLDQYSFKAAAKSTNTTNVIKKSQELTLSDGSKFVIFEYFEENPFFIVNPGMASLLNSYYRKTETNDEPVVENCIVLEPDDEAPFFGFGDVKPGTYLKTIDNNLFISPLASHSTNDFLCILDGSDLIMRPIDSIHLVGQEFPKEEVFAPHSRKLNQFCKDRLKVAAYRIFAKGKDLLMNQLDQMFPYFSEGSKRKWLKEYCDCVKKGKDNVWVLKDSFSVVGEEDLRKLVTPENICQYESMLATERHMQDLGYKCYENEEDDDEYDLFIPSWVLSRNFVNSSSGRGLLELNSNSAGTGNDELFSFRKIKLKKGNESENRRIIAECQSTYKERSNKIWNMHMNAIHSTEVVEPVLPQKKVVNDGPSETTATEMACLTIIRTYLNGNESYTKTEKIFDSKVIKAYFRARKTVKVEEKKPTFTCSSCGQLGHMKTNKTCPNFAGVNKVVKKKPEEKKPIVIYQEKLYRLVSSFMSIPFSSAFHRPVSLKKFPNYGLIVQNPIDLGTIKNNIKLGKYSKFEFLLNDLKLMRDNCAIYNGENHSLTEIANSIYQQGMTYYEENKNGLKELEAQIEKDDSPINI